MNVKEKVHAYEEIVLISPMTSSNVQVSQNTNNNSKEKCTPRKSPVTPKTPATVTRKSVSPKTPEQIIGSDVPIETRLSQNKDRLNTQIVESQSTDIHETPGRKSSVRKSRTSRVSTRVSLKKLSLKHGKLLPSVEKRSEVRTDDKYNINIKHFNAYQLLLLMGFFSVVDNSLSW